MRGRAEIDEETRKTKRVSPVTAGALGVILWGGGFLYVGRPFIASAFLCALLAAGTLFGSLSGLFPFWISDPLLRDLHWAWSPGPSLLLSGGGFSLLWWGSVVLPVEIARREARIPGRGDRNPYILVAASLLPMVGRFAREEYRRGYLRGLFYLWVPMAVLAAAKLWREGVQEPYFLAFLGIFTLSGAVTLIDLFGTVTGAFLAAGWLRPHQRGGRTEWKFVVLGTFLVAVTGLYLLGGPVGRAVKNRSVSWAVMADDRGFHVSSGMLRRVIRGWERRVAPVEDLLQRLR
jgi:hypothetical protein